MATCETCGNDYDKAFQVVMMANSIRSTASSAQFMPWRQSASIAERASSGTDLKRVVPIIAATTAPKKKA